jgi:hypothetical protein
VTRVIVELTIEGDEENAVYVVDALLDVGLLQDAINDHDLDAGPMRVTCALAWPAADYQNGEVTVHCAGGCGDYVVSATSAATGKCQACGGDLGPPADAGA